jgi:predicted nucleic acid-binding protein
MIGYIDSSVFLARFLGEDRSAEAGELMGHLSGAVVSRVTEVEVRRGLALIESVVERSLAEALWAHQWRTMNVVDVDEKVAGLAAQIAMATRVRSLDAIHLATAALAKAPAMLTFDQRLAQAARAFDLNVLGVAPGQA